MNFLQQFIDFLLNQKNKPSFLTVKNYKADVRQFIVWFEQTSRLSFDPSKVSPQILYDYRKSRNLSDSSAKRHTSSLRKFFKFLKMRGIITSDVFPDTDYKKQIEADPWMIRNFKNFLYEYNKSNLTIKNYINDIKSFLSWLQDVSLVGHAWSKESTSLFSKINLPVIEEYKRRLISTNFSPATVNRKLASLRSYLGWAKSQGLLTNPQTSQFEQAKADEISNIKKEFYAPLSISTANFSTHKRLWYFIRHIRPNWYKKYHSYSITHYFHFAILTILSCAFGFGLYNYFFANTGNNANNAVLGVIQQAAIVPLAENARTLQGMSPITDSAKDNGVILALNSSGNLSIAGDQSHIF